MSNECPRCGFGGGSVIQGVDATPKWVNPPEHLQGCLPNKTECSGQQYRYRCVPLCTLKDMSPVKEGPCREMLDMKKQIECLKIHPILPNSRDDPWVSDNVTEACKGCGAKYFSRWEICVNCNKPVWREDESI